MLSSFKSDENYQLLKAALSGKLVMFRAGDSVSTLAGDFRFSGLHYESSDSLSKALVHVSVMIVKILGRSPCSSFFLCGLALSE